MQTTLFKTEETKNMETRENLQKIAGERQKFTAIFDRYGKKEGYNGVEERTVLLIDITDSNGKILCDHLWFAFTKGFEKLGYLKKGQMLSFIARAATYEKGAWEETKTDWGLKFPTKIEVIK